MEYYFLSLNYAQSSSIAAFYWSNRNFPNQLFSNSEGAHNRELRPIANKGTGSTLNEDRTLVRLLVPHYICLAITAFQIVAKYLLFVSQHLF